MGCMLFCRSVWALRTWIIIAIAFIGPCYLLAECGTLEAKCLYAIIAMAILWLTEAVPISVTAFVPVFLFPMIGLTTGSYVSSKYINDTSMLFIGGLFVAVAIEETGLHKRMALGIIKVVGVSPSMLLLGLMLPTWFLSMWISNTATTSMMLPIITAVMDQLKQSELGDEETGHFDNEAYDRNSFDDINRPSKLASTHRDADRKTIKRKKAELNRMSKMLALGVAYAANTGGIATLVGTPPNLVLQGAANERYNAIKAGSNSGISFANWMGFAVPLSIIILFVAWLWLQLVFVRCGCCLKENRKRATEIKRVVREEFKKLGKISFAEVMVLILFIILALLWIFRDLPDIRGWTLGFKDKYVTDSTASLFISCLLFVMPAEVPNVFCWNKSSRERPKYKPILTWQAAVRKVPWGVIFLLGGGFALADASKISGLSQWLSCELQSINTFDPLVINLIISAIVAAATEVTSNTATATLLLPIIFDLAVGLDLHPLYLMISVAIACSFAFMLPVATPPNAIVFSTGYLKIYDMALCGIIMNVIGIGGLTLAINTWAKPIFGLDTMPQIFKDLNVTSSACVQLCPS